jgi:hypothetical protein
MGGKERCRPSATAGNDQQLSKMDGNTFSHREGVNAPVGSTSVAENRFSRGAMKMDWRR